MPAELSSVGLPSGDQRSAVRGEKRSEGWTTPAAHELIMPKPCWVIVIAILLLVSSSAAVEKLVPGLGWRRDAGLGEEFLVVVQRVDVDLIWESVDHVANACGGDDAGGPSFALTSMRRPWPPRATSCRGRVPEAKIVDAGSSAWRRLPGLGAERGEEVAEGNGPDLDGHVGVRFVTRRAASSISTVSGGQCVRKEIVTSSPAVRRLEWPWWP